MPRPLGPSPELRKLVLERDGYGCACCGRSIIGERYTIGFRKRQGRGGRCIPSNLLTFLHECDRRIDSRIDPRDEANGYWVLSSQDPREVPVVLSGITGPGLGVWLDDAGGYLLEDPDSR